MSLAIDAVLPARFRSWVGKRPFMVLYLGDGTSTPRPRIVVDGLDLSFPRQVGAGWMSREAVPDVAWFEREFCTEHGPFRRGRMAPDGVYLFHFGFVAGHHPMPQRSDRAGWLQVRSYILERMKLKASQGADDTEWVRSGRSEPPPDTEAPRPRSRTRDAVHYVLLEVSPDADDAVVKSAYRQALKLNHPDRVAHLSKAIQDFAKDRTQQIVAAWEAIKRERGLR